MTGHTFITSLCECVGSCVPVCPVECIHSGETADGRRYTYIDQSRCVDCHACSDVCPIENAVINWWDPKALVFTLEEKPRPYGPSSLAEARQALERRVHSISSVDLRVRGQVQLWASDCAARVVDIFETLDPSDGSVRGAVLAAREHAWTLYQLGLDDHEALREERPPSALARMRFDAARKSSAAWKAAAMLASRTAPAKAAELAAEAACAACGGGGLAARFAADARYALHLVSSPRRAAAARETELLWQFKRLIARLSPGKIDDWPLPPSPTSDDGSDTSKHAQ